MQKFLLKIFAKKEVGLNQTPFKKNFVKIPLNHCFCKLS
ncbi:hypothetical protein BVAVS116_H0064 (plasmid) [Borreliella valaisiana VS116]|uniref:Uncharacterized protein n=1 Tax=Borreliella valaisiana VS116 TaxID=445987 RepID=C0R9C1_BORVA|nr:hypothetical protein BVAVS116_H0064 [Borreliella valaisiana VS116]